jgi:HSP20 family protein
MDERDRTTDLDAIRQRAREVRTTERDRGRQPVVSVWRPLERSVERGSDERGARAWSPRAEVFDRDGALVLRLELPGVERDDVEITVRGDRLVVDGERREARNQEERGYYESEWAYGRFHREIGLPEPVDPKDVSATFQNGVLEVRVPRRRRSERRKLVHVES